MWKRIIFGVLLVAACAAGLVALAAFNDKASDPPPARSAIERYLAAWSRGDDAAAAALTDRPGVARRSLRLSRDGLDGAPVDARVVGETRRLRDGEQATVRVRWSVPEFGPFEYATRVLAVPRASGDGWSVRWRERSLHPRLDAYTRLGTAAVTPRRGAILDREGRPLLSERPVVDIAVEVDRVRSPEATAAALASLLDVEAAPLARAVAQAGRGRFIPVLTLRTDDFAAKERALDAIPGVSFNHTAAQLGPTRSFGRALLGSVGPVTAEQVARSGGRLQAGDVAGQSGLSQRFDEHLAGTPTYSVVLRDRATGGQWRVLRRRRGRPARPLPTLLDFDVQMAAEVALDDGGLAPGANAALVAVEASSGDVLAVANRPVDSTYDRALLGRYPPGSTFKVVSTAALLRAGLSPDETVECPATLAVDGKPFRNFEGSASGAVPFREDFVESCNTAFVALADRLDRDDLTAVAHDFGLGEQLRTGVETALADVPPARDDVGHAAMMIGQDRILASPLTMAGVAATVAAGRWHAPRILPSAPRRSGPALDAGELETLRDLTRGVVIGGTGTALAATPGEVRGKSGTAEYGGGDPPPTHAWFIATRDDLAVGVLVEGGSSGGEVAAPVAQRFFAALDAGAS